MAGKNGKFYRANLQKVESGKLYPIADAFTVIENLQARKFDETVDVCFNLGVDPKHSDQMVRGATTLPNGIGKDVKVLAVVTGEAAKEAEAEGADFIGHKDMIEKIEKGWLEFDVIVATPDTLRDLTKVARVLGPRGLMPSKKTGTVTTEVGKAVAEQKKGSVAYKVEKAGILHAVLGKKSFGAQKLKENFMVLYDAVMKAKPSSSKGTYMKKIALSPTMGPSVLIDTNSIEGS